MNNNKELLNALLRKNFKSFVIKVFNEISPNAQYLDSWYIDVICDSLMNAFEDKENRIIINIPPRHTKSIISSVAFPAFILGHNPKAKIVAASYADDLASKLALDCKKIMESEWYKELFPGTRLSKKRSTNDFETTKGGGRYATSVGGVLTGRGGDYIIIDDPIKPSDTFSDTIREKTNDWYGSTLYSRLDNHNSGKIIVIMQRLHEDDFTGHLLSTDPSFKHIRIPAIAEENETWTVRDRILNKDKTFIRKKGEALHPSRYNLESLLKLKSTVGEYTFAGQYQQNPAPKDGGIIKQKWFRYYDLAKLWENIKNGEIEVMCIIQSWDTANKIEQHNDHSVCITILRDREGNNYVLDVYREKLEFPNLIRKITQMYNFAKEKYDYKIDVLIEDKASGTQIIQTLQNSHIIFPIAIKPEHDKETRLMSVSHLIENGSCLFPNDEPHWWLDFEQELLRFPQVKHDDQCDALSQALSYKTSSGSGKILTAKIKNKYDSYSPRLDLSNYNIL